MPWYVWLGLGCAAALVLIGLSYRFTSPETEEDIERRHWEDEQWYR